MPERYANGILSKNGRDKGPPYEGTFDVPVGSIDDLIAYLRETEPVQDFKGNDVIRFGVAARVHEGEHGRRCFLMNLEAHWKAKRRSEGAVVNEPASSVPEDESPF